MRVITAAAISSAAGMGADTTTTDTIAARDYPC